MPRHLLLLAAAAGCALAGPTDIPTVPICTTGTPSKTCYRMPVVGQGSCCGAYNITSALEAGFTHIDTSVDYGSQPTIAGAIAASGIPRSSLWITSKLNVESISLDMTGALTTLVLEPLNVTYVDLLLIHHAGRWQTDNNPRPPCFDPTLAGGNGTCASIYSVRGVARLPLPSNPARDHRLQVPPPGRDGHAGHRGGRPRAHVGSQQLAGPRFAANVRRLRLFPDNQPD